VSNVPEAYRVRGPSALAGDPRRVGHLALVLALTDWKLRFFDSVLGYVWSLLRPLMLFGTLYVVFSLLVDIGAGVEYYPLTLLIGVVLFSAFAEITSSSVTSMLDRENLVRKVACPRLAIPLSVATLATFGLLLNLITVAIFVAGNGLEPRWSWLLLPLPLAGVLVFATGIGMLLSALYVPFRDARPIWEVISQALFYATPVLWPVQLLEGEADWLEKLVMCNPLAVLIQSFRWLLVGSDAPSPVDVTGSWAWMAVPAAIAIGCCVLGAVVFSRTAPTAAEDL
jgi:ABC-2 type transport system permease protein